MSQVRYYRVALLVCAIVLAIWQYTIVFSKDTAPPEEGADVLSFTTNSGEIVTIPNDSRPYTVVIFWNAASDRSIRQVHEAMSLKGNEAFDSLATMYFVDLNDSITVARSIDEFNDPDNPFAYAPHGNFLDRHDIRSLPYTVIFNDQGKVVEQLEGYTQGAMAGLTGRLEMMHRMMRGGGPFQFQIGGGKP